jgi:hypothetical protein
MTTQLTVEQAHHLHMLAQGLHPERPYHTSDVARIVEGAGGLQAQEYPSAALGVRARSHGLLAEDVRRAREVDRSIVMTWAMRGTLHLVPAADLGWLLKLLGPLFIQQGERRFQQLGLSEEIRVEALAAIREILGTRGPLIRSELANALAARGIPVEGQAIAHLVRYAALEGLVCLGPKVKGGLTCVLLDDWVDTPGKPPDKEGALAALARRYFGAFGPATLGDFAKWSGLPVGQARAGFEAVADELAEVEALGEAAWLPQRHLDWLDWQAGEAVVRLLPRYDTYLLGYRSRDPLVIASAAKKILPGGGIIREALIVNGRAVGTWAKAHKKGWIEVAVDMFEPVDDGVRARIEAEGRDVGRFLGQEARVTVEGPGTYP